MLSKANDMKECKKCKEVMPLTDFYKSKQNSDNLQSYCKECHKRINIQWGRNNPKRKKQLWRNSVYKLEEGWYEQALIKQGFRCLGCHTHQKDLEYALCVDHNHTTDKPRGLLCKPCNSALGFAQDDPDTLRRLADYLDERGSYGNTEETRKTKES
jgi:hypothetical protein